MRELKVLEANFKLEFCLSLSLSLFPIPALLLQLKHLVARENMSCYDTYLTRSACAQTALIDPPAMTLLFRMCLLPNSVDHTIVVKITTFVIQNKNKVTLYL